MRLVIGVVRITDALFHLGPTSVSQEAVVDVSRVCERTIASIYLCTYTTSPVWTD